MGYLATDLDGTFIPNANEPQSAEAVTVLAEQLPRSGVEMIFVTGRHLESVRDAIDQHRLPYPTWILCDVGTSVYQHQGQGRFEKVTAYEERLEQITGHFDAETLRRQIDQEVSGVRLQEPVKQAAHKLSYYAPADQLERCVAEIEQLLSRLEAPYGIVSSVDPFNGQGLIDVLPVGVSKAFGIDWWCDYRQLDPGQVVFAGDTGNDYAALTAGYRAIVVANADRHLARRVLEEHARRGWTDRLLLAQQPSTAGVLEGCRWFGLIENQSPEPSPESIPPHQLHRHLGANLLACNRTRFCVWAPKPQRLEVELVDQGRRVPMTKTPSGYHVADVDGVGHGAKYQYRIEGERSRPDPASRFQPSGVHGPSQVVARQFAWTDTNWQGVDRDDLIVYELHLGTFTDEGTFAAAIERLDELVELGVTAVELMPVADSAGKWNWGYDGVDLFAVRRTYGTPDDFRHFVNAAHEKGLAVILDVVYNHLGPEGNYSGEFGPYLSERHRTVWGEAPNFDDPVHSGPVRRFFIANAVSWFDEYHIDGLRVDAIHCMSDDTWPHVTAEMSDAVAAWRRETGRAGLLIAESNIYDPEMLVPTDADGIGFDAQWCDDFLHSVFAALRPGEQLTDRIYEHHHDLQQTLRMGYVHQGTFRQHWRRTALAERVDTRGLIYSIQNHDFIGNHPLGLRLHQLASPAAQRAAAALLLLVPPIPMLFMGEEFACENPFHFFVDFGDEHLRQAVVEGRKREYPQHDWSQGHTPVDPLAFETSRIGPATAGDAGMRRWYRTLLGVRKQWRASGLLRDDRLSVRTDAKAGLYVLRYSSPDQTAVVAVRLSPASAAATAHELHVEEDLLQDSFAEPFLPQRPANGGRGTEPAPERSPANVLLPNHAKIFYRGPS